MSLKEINSFENCFSELFVKLEWRIGTDLSSEISRV